MNAWSALILMVNQIIYTIYTLGCGHCPTVHPVTGLYLLSSHTHISSFTHITHYYVCILQISVSLHPLLLMLMPPFYMSAINNKTHFELTAYECMWLASYYLMDIPYSAKLYIFIMSLVIYHIPIFLSIRILHDQWPWVRVPSHIIIW